MKKSDQPIDNLLKQAVKEDFENFEKPPISKDESWKQIYKQLDSSQYRDKQKKWLNPKGGAIAVVCFFVLISGFLFKGQSSMAFGWITEFFFSQKEDMVRFQSSNKPMESLDRDQPKPPDEAIFVPVVTTEHKVNLEEAINLVDFPIYVPTYIPKGFALEYIKVICANEDCDSVYFKYKSNNGSQLNLKEEYFKGTYNMTGGIANVTETREITINGHKAMLAITNKYQWKFLNWTTTHYHFSISGQVPEEELIKFGRSLTIKKEK